MRTSFPRLAAHLLRLRLLGRAGAAGSIFNFFCRFRAEVLSETLISGGVKSRENTKKQDSGNRTNRLGAGEFVDLINKKRPKKVRANRGFTGRRRERGPC